MNFGGRIILLGLYSHSLVRFTSAMDAFKALQKDGEQGVK